MRRYTEKAVMVELDLFDPWSGTQYLVPGRIQTHLQIHHRSACQLIVNLPKSSALQYDCNPQICVSHASCTMQYAISTD